MNCGPRTRFVVADEQGQPLIVHNCENVTQAVARDILTHGMEIAERAGYAIVLHVHDEIISETPDTPQYTSGGLAACMSQKPYYAMDLPLSAAGFETYRYRKG